MANICRGRKPTKTSSKAGRGKEEESHFLLHHHLNQLQPPPKKKQKTSPPVPGAHIVGSTLGCRDRHNKVSTAKGPRDRRVRLSAHTAIEFYDVQDRLGYDRPSMAVDWLLNNAKSAIDGLDIRLPPAWGPTSVDQSFQDPTTPNNNNNNMFSSSFNGGEGGYFDGHFFTQREPLQSSAPPSWMDPIASTSLYGSGGGGGGFSGFRVPSWIQGSEEQDDEPESTSHLQY